MSLAAKVGDYPTELEFVLEEAKRVRVEAEQVRVAEAEDAHKDAEGACSKIDTLTRSCQEARGEDMKLAEQEQSKLKKRN